MFKPVNRTASVRAEPNQILLSQLETTWRNKLLKEGPASADISDSSKQQQKRIECLLNDRLGGKTFGHCIDFGCGKGRMLPYLSNICSHIWAIDVVPELLPVAKGKASNVSTHKLACPIKLPGPRGEIDLIFACMVFQHITDDPLLSEIISQLYTWLRPGGTVVIIDSQSDRNLTIKSRGPLVFSTAFRLAAGWKSEKVTLSERSLDHWILSGTRA